jgi:hypothetical protein
MLACPLISSPAIKAVCLEIWMPQSFQAPRVGVCAGTVDHPAGGGDPGVGGAANDYNVLS